MTENKDNYSIIASKTSLSSKKAYKKMFILTVISFWLIFSSVSFVYNALPQNESLAYEISLNHFISPNIYLPLEKQQPYMCSGYSVSFLKQFYNLQSNTRDSYQQMSYSLPFLHGVPPYRLANYLNNSSFNTGVYRGTLTNLFHHIVNDRPVIVLVGEGISWQHYLVLVGYDIEHEKLFFYDPGEPLQVHENIMKGNNELSFQEFKAIWANGLPLYNHIYIPGYLG